MYKKMRTKQTYSNINKTISEIQNNKLLNLLNK